MYKGGVRLSDNGQQAVSLLRFHRQLLESVFGKKWFTKPRRHPAYRRWELLNRHIANDALLEEKASLADLTDIGRSLLDAQLLVPLGGGDLASLDAGDLSKYGDKKMQVFLKSRLPREEFFEDVMCELTFAGWHRAYGRAVEPDQSDGMPDLKIDLPPRILADCKRLTSVNVNSLKNHLRKANTQVARYNKENGTDHPGLAVLDISAAVNAGQVSDDSIPRSVADFQKIVEGLLHGPYSSLSAALILWDDVLVETVGQKTWYKFRRRYRVVKHRAPAHALADEKLFAQVEAWNSVLWWTPLRRPLEIRSTAEFDRLTAALKIDHPFALEALFRPDRIQVLFFDDKSGRRFTLFLKKFDATPRFAIVLGADEIPSIDDQPSKIHLQFALPLQLDIETEFTPLQAVAEAVKNHTVQFTVGGQSYDYICGTEFSIPPEQFCKALRQTSRSDTWMYAGLSVPNSPATAAAFVTLAFVLDLAKYSTWRSA